MRNITSRLEWVANHQLPKIFHNPTQVSCMIRLILFSWYLYFFIFVFYLPVHSQEISIRYENYKIIYEPDDEAEGRLLLKTLEKVNPEFEIFFNFKIAQLVEIYLPPQPADFRRLASVNLPPWVQGVYLTEKQKIIVKKSGRMNEPADLAEVLTHELSHLYLQHRFGEIKIPTWFNEGLAQKLSGKKIQISEGMILANALFARTFIGLEEIDSLSSFSENRARLAYGESLHAVLFLENYIRTKGLNWTKYFDIIYASGFEKAIQEVTGQDLIDFEIKWYRSVKEKYQWFIIFNWENLIWLVMVLVLIGAMYAVRYRNRRVLLQWEQEEAMWTDDNHLTQNS
jgi:hypothetical protein